MTTSVTNWPAPIAATSTSAAATEPETVEDDSGTAMAAAAAMSARAGDPTRRPGARARPQHAANAERRQEVPVAGGAEAETLADEHEEDSERAVDRAREDLGADERERVGVLAKRLPADGEVGADRGVDLLDGAGGAAQRLARKRGHDRGADEERRAVDGEGHGGRAQEEQRGAEGGPGDDAEAR